VLLQVVLLLVDWDVPWRRRPVHVVLHCHALAFGCQGGAWPEAVDHDLPVPRLQTMTGMPVEEAQQRLQTLETCFHQAQALELRVTLPLARLWAHQYQPLCFALINVGEDDEHLFPDSVSVPAERIDGGIGCCIVLQA
jgi:hypothetical protein